MILNPIVCEKCKRELQPEMLGVDMRDGDLKILYKYLRRLR